MIKSVYSVRAVTCSYQCGRNDIVMHVLAESDVRRCKFKRAATPAGFVAYEQPTNYIETDMYKINTISLNLWWTLIFQLCG